MSTTLNLLESFLILFSRSSIKWIFNLIFLSFLSSKNSLRILAQLVVILRGPFSKHVLSRNSLVCKRQLALINQLCITNRGRHITRGGLCIYFPCIPGRCSSHRDQISGAFCFNYRWITENMCFPFENTEKLRSIVTQIKQRMWYNCPLEQRQTQDQIFLGEKTNS